MVKLCNQLIEMKKENQLILMTDKLLEAMRGLYEDNEKRIWKCQALNNFLVVDTWAALQVATATTLLAPFLIYPKNGRAPNSKTYEQRTMTAPNATTSATSRTPSMADHEDFSHLQVNNGETPSYSSNKTTLQIRETKQVQNPHR
jgi:hypothetical protein